MILGEHLKAHGGIKACHGKILYCQRGMSVKNMSIFLPPFQYCKEQVCENKEWRCESPSEASHRLRRDQNTHDRHERLKKKKKHLLQVGLFPVFCI